MTATGNWFEKCESYGILFDDTTNRYSKCSAQPPSLIENNRFSSMGVAPMFLDNPASRHFWNVTIQFNSMVGGISLPTGKSHFCDVVLRGNARTVYSGIHCSLHTGITARYNVTFRVTPGSGCKYQGTGNTYAGVVSPGRMFTNYLSGDFSLPLGSPLVGAANGAGVFPKDDYRGDPRPQGGLDAGAAERR